MFRIIKLKCKVRMYCVDGKMVQFCITSLTNETVSLVANLNSVDLSASVLDPSLVVSGVRTIGLKNKGTANAPET